jgi:hypothetical protein
MKTKIDNLKDADAQIEVWEWKQSLFDEIKGLEKYSRFDYIIHKAKISKKYIIENSEFGKQHYSV